MKRTLLLSICVAGGLLACVAALRVTAQGPAPIPASGVARPTIAVVDIGTVFREHKRYKAQMEDVNTDIKTLEAHFKTQRDSLEALIEQAKELKIGSPGYKEAEKQFAARDADLRVEMKLQNKEIGERRSKINYQTYLHIVGEVEKFATANGIQLVLRFNSDPINPDNPQSVQLGIARPVVHQTGRDITQYIVNAVNVGFTPRVSGRGVVPRR